MQRLATTAAAPANASASSRNTPPVAVLSIRCAVACDIPRTPFTQCISYVINSHTVGMLFARVSRLITEVIV